MEENIQNEEFIWEDDDKGFGEDYSQEERAKLEEIYANTLTEITSCKRYYCRYQRQGYHHEHRL